LYDYISSLRMENSGILNSAFSFLTLQREACSSKEAVYVTVKKMMEQSESPLKDSFFETVLQKIQQITKNSKAEKAVELIKEIDDKVIIFTEYRASQLYLQWFLKQHGITSVPFRGGFRRGKKEWMKELFENHAQVFIATEAGGEGINLQFCSHIINFDLPWNPMRLEQRIGRIHRLGQENDVHIYNFAIKDTIEENVLKLLYEKINLFERVIGELDEILTRLDCRNIEEYLQDIFLKSQTEGEMKVKMGNLSSLIQFADTIRMEDEAHAAEGNTSIS